MSSRRVRELLLDGTVPPALFEVTPFNKNRKSKPAGLVTCYHVVDTVNRITQVVMLALVGIVIGGLAGRIDPPAVVLSTGILAGMAATPLVMTLPERRFLKEFPKDLGRLLWLRCPKTGRSIQYMNLTELRDAAREAVIKAAYDVLVAEQELIPQSQCDVARQNCRSIHRLLLKYCLVGMDYTVHYNDARKRLVNESARHI